MKYLLGADKRMPDMEQLATPRYPRITMYKGVVLKRADVAIPTFSRSAALKRADVAIPTFSRSTVLKGADVAVSTLSRSVSIEQRP